MACIQWLINYFILSTFYTFIFANSIYDYTNDNYGSYKHNSFNLSPIYFEVKAFYANYIVFYNTSNWF